MVDSVDVDVGEKMRELSSRMSDIDRRLGKKNLSTEEKQRLRREYVSAEREFRELELAVQ